MYNYIYIMINNHSIEAVERLGAMCAVSIFPSFFLRHSQRHFSWSYKMTQWENVQNKYKNNSNM